ncbi:MAG: hypothetical protein DRP56_10525 [Planctomycetota bacterium]|nr:MAG: hypothetical protein DRP56_10525 [Planctomycetota bacterium]
MIITDTDIAKVDAEVFSSAAYGSQVRCGGTNGIVAGTQFTASGVDFNSSQVTAGCVIYLHSADGTIDGVFEIVSVIDSTHLTVSQIRNDPTDSAIAVGSASGLTWSIKTLGPQIGAAELELSIRLGLKPGKADAAYSLDEIQNTDTIKQIAIAVLLAGVYTVLYTTSADATVRAGHEAKRAWYGQQVERLLAGVTIVLPAS